MHTNALREYLLIVDDEEFILDLLKRQLQPSGYNILSATSGEAGLEILRTQQVGVIITDQSMPGMDGITFLNQVRDIDDEVVLIMLTGNGTLANAVTAINELQIFSYIMKPWSMPVLQSVIKDAFKHYEMTTLYRKTLKRTYQLNEHLTKENKKLQEHIEELEMKLEKLQGTGS
jgi:DNA-binding NtrC family response regulator